MCEFLQMDKHKFINAVSNIIMQKEGALKDKLGYTTSKCCNVRTREKKAVNNYLFESLRVCKETIEKILHSFNFCCNQTIVERAILCYPFQSPYFIIRSQGVTLLTICTRKLAVRG